MSKPVGLRLVAVLEAFKGCLALFIGFGIQFFFNENAQLIAERLETHLHLNPANYYSQLFISSTSALTQQQIILIAIGAALYALIRFIEAYGLWKNMRWTEWFALVSGGIYIPFEMYEIIKKISWLSVGALIINLLVVAYIAYFLIQSKKYHNSH